MKKIKITTPENIEVEYTLADLGSRTAAALVDFLIQGIIIIILLIGIALIEYYAPLFWEKYYGWILGISIIIFAIILLGYFIGMELTMNGATLGKKLLKLRTIRNNGQPLTLIHSGIRNLFRIFIDMFGIGVVFMFFSKEHKRIGDFAASTIVVIDQKSTRPITLDNLINSKEDFGYYISEEEQDLLRDYFERRRELINYSELREELKLYFTKKFEANGILQDWKEFIDKL